MSHFFKQYLNPKTLLWSNFSNSLKVLVIFTVLSISYFSIIWIQLSFASENLTQFRFSYPEIEHPAQSDRLISFLLADPNDGFDIAGGIYRLQAEQLSSIFVGFISPVKNPYSQMGHIAFRLNFCEFELCSKPDLSIVVSPQAYKFKPDSFLSLIGGVLGFYEAKLFFYLSEDYQELMSQEGRHISWFKLSSTVEQKKNLLSEFSHDRNRSLGAWLHFSHSCASITANYLEKIEYKTDFQFSFYGLSPLDVICNLSFQKRIEVPPDLFSELDKLNHFCKNHLTK